MNLLLLLLVLALIAGLGRNRLFSFRAQSPEDYADTGPAFDMRQHLSGDILSEGLIYGPKGRVTNSFTARMKGSWEVDTGTLTEDFTYSNGRDQARKWHLTLGEGGHFTATAEDVIGTATGRVSGSTVSMRYTIVLPAESGGHRLHVTDWLYLTHSGVILNRSEMRKFGIKVAELVATMRPAPTGD